MSAPTRSGKSGSRGEPEKTRAAILTAALEEFAHEGAAGARTEEIARRAGVNKALLYYYFTDKDGLYAAALEQVISGLIDRAMPVLERTDLPPRERLLLYAKTHFDHIASSPAHSRLVQREFMRSAGRTLSPAASRVFEHYGKPLYFKLVQLIEEGSKSGDFRKVDARQTVTSVLGTIVFYFINIPAMRLMNPGDPFSAERLADRRAAVLDFISAALFLPDKSKKGKHT
ncbi:MAG TPA: TetR/AcrR family transcriptional regulator [Verrucomicrobiae bacterium]|jgi:TetR/AcrR family transcriptional regulator|nr:TetR/AcrR family transcriptional regulator [Verrucomicrobiae bacterium]